MVSKRRGREKLHFLNPVPIRLVHDRWVSKYAEPWAAALSGLKNRLETPMKRFSRFTSARPRDGRVAHHAGVASIRLNELHSPGRFTGRVEEFDADSHDAEGFPVRWVNLANVAQLVFLCRGGVDASHGFVVEHLVKA